jgi:hypothetical protein
VVSPLGPLDFLNLMLGNGEHFPGMPAIAFVELALGALATDPENGDIDELPYENIVHLRRCLQEAIIQKRFHPKYSIWADWNRSRTAS